MKVNGLQCIEVRAELSARMDDEASRDLQGKVDLHLTGCSDCRRYQQALTAVRRQLRVQPAGDVPDMTRTIVEKVQARRAFEPRPFLRTALASVLATALLAGLLTVAGDRERVDVASAAAIVTRVREAARHLSEYSATFDVVERGWHPDVPERYFDVSVRYRAPEMLQVTTRDRTDYPGDAWVPSNATLITNRTKSYVRQSLPCPPPTLSGCSVPAKPTSRLTVHRQPLEGSSPSVTDIVLPLETLASTDGVEVVGAGERILERDTVHVRVPFWQGHVLASAVQPGAARPFDPAATVDLWLDASSWFPLRFTVTERGGREVALGAVATAISEGGVSVNEFRVPKKADHVVDAHFEDGGGPSLRPSFRAGLEQYRSGRTPDGHTITSFANGLAWLTVVTSEDATAPRSLLYSDVVVLPQAGPVYYEPGAYEHARVVDIFDGSNHIRLESNLPRETLLRIADSMPVRGKLVKRLRRGQVAIARVAPARVSGLEFFDAPSELPAGYKPSNATITQTEERLSSAVIRYSDPENEYAGGGIVITAVRAEDRLPASAEPFVQYAVGNDTARWSSLRGELEWIEGDTYRSVRVADFRADFAVSIARSMR